MGRLTGVPIHLLQRTTGVGSSIAKMAPVRSSSIASFSQFGESSIKKLSIRQKAGKHDLLVACRKIFQLRYPGMEATQIIRDHAMEPRAPLASRSPYFGVGVEGEALLIECSGVMPLG